MGSGKISAHIVGLFIGVSIVLRIVSGLFNAELKRTNPKLYERVGRPGDMSFDWQSYKRQLSFAWWLLLGGYLRLRNWRLAVLGAIQHLVLLSVICFIVYVIAQSLVSLA